MAAFVSPLSPSRALASDSTATIISGMYHECSDGEGVPFLTFCHFLSHLKIFGWEFDHKSGIEVFMQCTGGELSPEDTLDMRKLDPKSFRAALQAVAIHIHGSAYGLSKQGDAHSPDAETAPRRSSSAMMNEQASKVSALQDMLRDINSRNNESSFNLKNVSEMKGGMFDVEVISAAYEYEEAIRKLYSHYAVENQTLYGAAAEVAVNARSAFRLCRACSLVPDCVVAGELHDVAEKLRTGSRAGHHENKFWQDEKMLQRGEDPNWLQPARNNMTGEPRYTFPEIVELLAVATMHAPPRMHKASPEERVERIHDVFHSLLHLPKMAAPKEFDAESYLQQASRLSGADDKQEPSEKSLADIFEELRKELPDLPPKKDPNIPQPPPSAIPNLRPQPPTKEELIERAQRGLSESTKTGKKGKGKKAKKATSTHDGPILWDQVTFLGKRPEPADPEIPAMWQMDSKMRMLKHLDDHINLQREQAESLNTPATGWVLRMQLIDEPLRAPECKKSEEVSTLIETALTSRRLRNYDAAISLLIRARRLWAAVEAGRQAPLSSWSDVQPLVATPSPWAGNPGLGSPSYRPRQPRYAPAMHVAKDGTIQSRLEMTDEPLRRNYQAARETTSKMSIDIEEEPTEDDFPVTTARQLYDKRTVIDGVAMDQISPRALLKMPTTLEMDRTISPAEMRRSDGLEEGGSSGSRALPGLGFTTGRQSPPEGDPSQLSTWERRQKLQAAKAARERKDIPPTPQSARGRSPTSRPATSHAKSERRYNPKTDFIMARGDGELDLNALPTEAALFFFCELASLHSAVHEDELSAQLLYRALPHVKRLDNHSANAAVVWSGLGRVSFHLGNFEIATKLYMRARSIREKTLGGDTIDTATSYNNLACCLAAVDRPLEASAFVELAVEIFKELAGEDHPRTQTAIRNLDKARTAPKHMAVEVPHLFSLPVRDHNAFLKKGRKKKKKGKSGGSSRSSKGKK